jgi:tetratricopeptide (TPR) repeat protein
LRPRWQKFLIRPPALLLLLAPSFAQQPARQDDAFTILLHRGFALHQQADYNHALPLLQQAWKLDPRDYFVNLLLGIDLLRTGATEKSIRFLTTASHLRPTEDFPYEYLGEAQTQLGRYDDAASSFMKAVAVTHDAPDATESWIEFTLERFRQLAGQLRSSQTGLAAEYRLQARSYPAGDKRQRALLQQSAELDARAAGIWSELALADFTGGDDVEAQNNVVRALAADSFDLHAMLVRAMLAARAGDWKMTAALLNQIAARSRGLLNAAAPAWPPSLQPVDAKLITGAAAEFLACAGSRAVDCSQEPPSPSGHAGRAGLAGETSLSTTLFRENRWDRLATLADPPQNDPEAWFQRGVALAQMGQCLRAIPALERGLAAPTEGVYARFLLSWCYANEAGKVDMRIRQSGGNLALAHIIRADVLFRMQGDTAGAIAEYQAALSERKDDPKLLERLAEVQVAAGALAEAAQNADAALQLDAHRYSARQTLARIAMEQGRYADALTQLTVLAAQDPHDEGTQISLATALSQLDKPAQALQHLEPVLASGYPDQKGNLHSLLGALLRKAGRPAEAAQAFSTARQLSETYQQSTHRDQEPAR